MADQKFVFIGDRGSIGEVALRNGDTFEADPDWIRNQGFPAEAVSSTQLVEPETPAREKE